LAKVIDPRHVIAATGLLVVVQRHERGTGAYRPDFLCFLPRDRGDDAPRLDGWRTEVEEGEASVRFAGSILLPGAS